MDAVTSAPNQSEYTRSPTSARQLGWWGVLPPVEHAGNRWWLPLSDTALVVLTEAILQSAGPDSEAGVPPHVVDRLAQAFSLDPPLLFYALLKHHAFVEAAFGISHGGILSVTELAQSFAERVLSECSSGEWELAAPEVSADQQFRWSRLMAQARRVPANHWIESMGQWLEVGGPVAVDATWLKSLPNLIWDSQPAVAAANVGTGLLSQLARSRTRELELSRSFDEVVKKRNNESAKQLAYGLSHEINNPLANISARAQQLAREESNPQRIKSLEQIVQQVYRAHEMIAGLMFYANPPEADREEVDLSVLVGEAVDDFVHACEEAGIRLYSELPDSPAVAKVDRSMMLEAIRVLLRNSIEAIGTGGTIVASIEEAEGGRVRAAASDRTSSSPDQITGRCWLIHIADSGPGLDPLSSKHAFDPFFSGREAGRGLGLGLCRAYRIVELNQASISVTPGLSGCVATIAVAAAQ